MAILTPMAKWIPPYFWLVTVVDLEHLYMPVRLSLAQSITKVLKQYLSETELSLNLSLLAAE